MAENELNNPVESTAGILLQLMEYVRQLAAFERNPDVKIAILSNACGERFDDLKRILPIAMAAEQRVAAASGTGGGLAGMVTDLREETRLCIEALERGRENTRQELEKTASARRAIKAYAG